MAAAALSLICAGTMACSSDEPASTPGGDFDADVGPVFETGTLADSPQPTDLGRDGGDGGDDKAVDGDARPSLSLSDLAALTPNLGDRGQACLSCVNDRCSAEVSACINDPACVAAMACVARQCGAPDSGSIVACAATCASPAMLLRLVTIYTCSNGSCQSSCQAPADAGPSSPKETGTAASDGGGGSVGGDADAGLSEDAPATLDAVLSSQAG